MHFNARDGKVTHWSNRWLERAHHQIGEPLNGAGVVASRAVRRRIKRRASERANDIFQGTRVRAHPVLEGPHPQASLLPAPVEWLHSRLSVTIHPLPCRRADHQVQVHVQQAPIAWRETHHLPPVQENNDTLRDPMLRRLLTNRVLHYLRGAYQMIRTGRLDLDLLPQPPNKLIQQIPSPIKFIRLPCLKCQLTTPRVVGSYQVPNQMYIILGSGVNRRHAHPNLPCNGGNKLPGLPLMQVTARLTPTVTMMETTGCKLMWCLMVRVMRSVIVLRALPRRGRGEDHDDWAWSSGGSAKVWGSGASVLWRSYI